MRFRKKPVVIDAIQYIGSNGDAIERWANPREVKEWNIKEYPVLEKREGDQSGMHLQIRTLDGTMTAMPGDWIIKGVAGEFYPCKPDVFEMTYDPASV